MILSKFKCWVVFIGQMEIPGVLLVVVIIIIFITTHGKLTIVWDFATPI